MVKGSHTEEQAGALNTVYNQKNDRVWEVKASLEDKDAELNIEVSSVLTQQQELTLLVGDLSRRKEGLKAILDALDNAIGNEAIEATTSWIDATKAQIDSAKEEMVEIGKLYDKRSRMDIANLATINGERMQMEKDFSIRLNEASRYLAARNPGC